MDRFPLPHIFLYIKKYSYRPLIQSIVHAHPNPPVVNGTMLTKKNVIFFSVLLLSVATLYFTRNNYHCLWHLGALRLLSSKDSFVLLEIFIAGFCFSSCCKREIAQINILNLLLVFSWTINKPFHHNWSFNLYLI